MNETTDPQFTIGQRVRYQNTRDTGRVTATWAWPEDDEFYPGWHGADVIMDNQFSPPPVPVRFRIQARKFEPLPDDYLDDGEALAHIASVMAGGMPRDNAEARQMLAEILGVMRRNDRIKGS